MEILRLIWRNTRRHPLRNVLTTLGIALALLAFCLIQTMLDSWYSGVRATARDRLIVRNAVSLIFFLPISYFESVSRVPGVKTTAYATWFGGIHKGESYDFAQFAEKYYLDVYPEFLLSPEEREAYEEDRAGAIIGADLAEIYDLKIGDRISLRGTIFTGIWDFNIRGIFHTRDPEFGRRTMLFHWEYLNERVKRDYPVMGPDQVGVYVTQLAPGADPVVVSKAIDDRFANSSAETLTETETAFVRGFLSMSSTIITAIDLISYVVIVIMLLVLANTMLMATNERFIEYSVLKALGFDRTRLAMIIFGEALLISLSGFVLLCLILIPIFSAPERVILGELINVFPVFRLSPVILGGCFLASLLVAGISGLVPARKVLGMKVAEGLRRFG